MRHLLPPVSVAALLFLIAGCDESPPLAVTSKTEAVKLVTRHINGNVDGIFWVNAETGDVRQVHPRKLGKQ